MFSATRNRCTPRTYHILNKKSLWTGFTRFIPFDWRRMKNERYLARTHSLVRDSAGHSNVGIDPLRLILLPVKEYFLLVLLIIYDWYVSHMICYQCHSNIPRNVTSFYFDTILPILTIFLFIFSMVSSSGNV